MSVKKILKKYKYSSTAIKISNFISNQLNKNKIKKIKILEFGVDKGISTALFLKYCKESSSKLYSADIIDYGNLFKDNNWSFINTRDDNHNEINNLAKGKVDVIFLDTEHTSSHVEKIIYLYFNKLKTNGFFLIDDISWLPYTKGSYRDHEWIENNNKKTFFKLLDIYNSNQKNITIQFFFDYSGLALIKKINNKNLCFPKKIHSRNYSINNMARKILK
tara:strand:- start:53 stop:709 length:657 start_codon:yes stop_codon:yes gene_type:complete